MSRRQHDGVAMYIDRDGEGLDEFKIEEIPEPHRVKFGMPTPQNPLLDIP